MTKKTITTSLNLLGKLMSIAKTHTELSDDFKNLDKNAFNKKYKPSGFKGFSSKDSKNATFRRLALDLSSQNLPIGKELTLKYKGVSKSKHLKIKKNPLIYGKKRGNIKTKKKSNWIQWTYLKNLWDSKLQSYNVTNYDECYKQIKNLNNVQDLSGYSTKAGFQQVLWRVEYIAIDIHHKKLTKKPQWITFDSGISFGIKDLIYLFNKCKKAFENWLNSLKKNQSGKYTKVFTINVEILRVKR